MSPLSELQISHSKRVYSNLLMFIVISRHTSILSAEINNFSEIECPFLLLQIQNETNYSLYSVLHMLRGQDKKKFSVFP
jgi:hypothetical protein